MTVMEDAIMEVDITVLMDAADAHTSNFCINSKKINFALFVLRVLIFCIHFKTIILNRWNKVLSMLYHLIS